MTFFGEVQRVLVLCKLIPASTIVEVTCHYWKCITKHNLYWYSNDKVPLEVATISNLKDTSHNAVSTTKCSWIHYCKMHTDWHSDLRSTKQAATVAVCTGPVAIDDDFRVILTFLILAVDRHWWQFSL
jgi:hypothetical protein